MAAPPNRGRRRSNRTGGFAEGARALPTESEPRRGQESLLLRHGRDAARWVWAPVLRHLRSRPDVPRGAIGARQRSQRGGREFLERYQLREEFQQCDGFQADDGRPLRDGRDRSLVQGLLSQRSGKYVAFSRSFVQFEGEGDTANARPRAIGGHPAAVLRVACRRKAPESPYANEEGYVPVGKLQDYAAGRSNGCTSWSQSDAAKIIPMMQQPTTLYIYPESADIAAVAQAVKAGKSPSRAGFILERLLLERNTLSEILAKGNPRAGPHSIQEEPSGSAAAATADLQGAVKSASCTTCRRKLEAPAGPSGSEQA